MTVVIGVDYLDEILVIADTRVSYGGKYDKNYGLKKLLIFGNKNKVLILGFCGKVCAAQAVIRHIMEDKLTPNYKRRLIISHLKEDIRRWIEEITTTLPSDQRDRLSFMLCALESLRRRPVKNEGVTKILPFFERHIYTYRIKGDGKVEVVDDELEKRNILVKCNIAVIGIEEELVSKISKNAADLINFGRKMPNFHIARAVVLEHTISSIFQEVDHKKVGGPFQIVRIVPPPNPSQLIYQWSQVGNKNIEVTHKNDRTTMTNLSTNETCILLPIWEWPC
jgi:hypothetical protein